LCGITGGYFYPDYNYLCNVIVNKPDWVGNCTDGITYCDVLAAWKNLCNTPLEREGMFGSHSGRKTGYLFGVWGGAQDSVLMLSAQHKTVKHAMKYKRDASFLLSLPKENNTELTLRVPKWRSIYFEHHQLAMALNNS